MPAGTIALTNNSTTVIGTGTNFTSELKANDFLVAIVGGVTYTLGVQSVNSATGLTLITAYNGPTATGVAWTAVPNAALVGITAQVAADVAKAIRGLNLDKANWQQVYSGSGNITINLPDGSQYSGPSWNAVANSVTGKMDKAKNLEDLTDKSAARTNLGFVDEVLPVSLGGTGGNNQSAARSGLGLKSGATTDVIGSSGTASAVNKVPLIGSTYTVTSGVRAFTFASNNTPAFSAANDGQWTPPLVISNGQNNSAAAAMVFIRDGNFANYFGLDADNQWAHGGWSTPGARYRFWSERITTVDGNGFIKRASPIVRVAETGETMPENFGEGNFIVGDLCAVNDEAEGVTVTKTDTGIYEIAGTNGPYPEGWTIEIPQDENGNRLCFASVTYESKKLILKINKRKFDIDTAMTVAGDPMDIPAGRWVDLRVSMPEYSVFNQKAVAAKESLGKQLEGELKAQVEIENPESSGS
ncbi:hypothetical protein [Pantoea sp. CFSAN033090]|uniref:phage tail fiber protein n=1 Tax=Pantoea sp. CFSAN033090 TaxID=1690502 RepID=UPI000691CA81|nr:hypothetical protein [Pantoea sp. CFSAN033090]